MVIEEVLDRRPGVTASYTGESGFSFGVRGSQHLEAIQKPDSHRDNAFVKHAAEYHQGEESEVKFKLEIVGHFSKPVEREVCEGVYVHTDTSDLGLFYPLKKLDKVVELVGGGSVINGAYPVYFFTDCYKTCVFEFLTVSKYNFKCYIIIVYLTLKLRGGGAKWPYL